jgi:thymidylate kinase
VKALTSDVLLVCLTGIDGSGKTTQANLLLQTLYLQRYLTMYEHSFSRKTIADDLGVRSSIDIFVKNLNKVTNNRLVMVTKTVVRLTIIFVDSWLTYTLYKIKHRGKIIITDRFFYDSLVYLAFLYRPLANQILIFSKFIPKPKITILLQVSSETAVNRKAEHTLNDAKILCGFYEMLKQIQPIITVDAQQSIQSTRYQIERIVWQRILC